MMIDRMIDRSKIMIDRSSSVVLGRKERDEGYREDIKGKEIRDKD